MRDTSFQKFWSSRPKVLYKNYSGKTFKKINRKISAMEFCFSLEFKKEHHCMHFSVNFANVFRTNILKIALRLHLPILDAALLFLNCRLSELYLGSCLMLLQKKISIIDVWQVPKKMSLTGFLMFPGGIGSDKWHEIVQSFWTSLTYCSVSLTLTFNML